MHKTVLSFIRYSILPVVLVSEFLYFFVFLGWSDQCTGTSSGYFATMLICQKVWSNFFFADFLLVSSFITTVWIGKHRAKYINVFRIISLIGSTPVNRGEGF